MSGRTRQALGVVLIAVMLWVVIYAPTPLVIYEPGLAFETEPLVQLGTGEASASHSTEARERGAFLLTTIKLTDAKYWQVIEAAWKKDFVVYSKDSVMKGKSEKDYLDLMALDMLASQNSAIEAAYIYAGIPYTTSTELVHPTNPSNQITIKAEDIGGPSAGLMFTLQSLNLLLDKDLTDGLRIAGTGTITADGRVGGIGGITYKVVAAHEAGAQLFLAPEANYAEAAAKAKELHSEMKVVPVTSLETAITAIEEAAN
ncbi:S16 family serine protease [Paenibacillus lupini]|uniref:S16 family serine protease n=1 Tax=Paenibacillus lupini TaxID=1450204 RepID=UPI00142089AC|nr:S16 family serine protease [Paenibacillus lupini]NIK25477.1 PDZ domain-containing protein [Paenibacillus lupini]